jgi:asparagine synthase (glutamine-hydrolysing)
VPEPRTALRGVRKLPPGHLLLIEPDPWRVDEVCYWRLEDSPVVEGDPGVLLLNELEAVSEIILRSDVPLGVALSGGLDSSSIAALLAKECPGELHAFSVGYEGRPGNDERNDAKALAENLGLWFHEVELGVAEAVKSFPALVHSFDDPIADMAGFGYQAIMRLARSRDVPVIFQGQGGDELYWGYPYLRQAVEASLERLAPGLDLGAVPVATVPGRTVIYDLVPEFQLARERDGELYRPEFAAALAAYPRPGSLFPVAGPADRLDLKITKAIIDLYLMENGIAQATAEHGQLGRAAAAPGRLPLRRDSGGPAQGAGRLPAARPRRGCARRPAGSCQTGSWTVRSGPSGLLTCRGPWRCSRATGHTSTTATWCSRRPAGGVHARAAPAAPPDGGERVAPVQASSCWCWNCGAA